MAWETPKQYPNLPAVLTLNTFGLLSLAEEARRLNERGTTLLQNFTLALPHVYC